MAEDVEASNDGVNTPADNLCNAPYTKSLLTHAHPEVCTHCIRVANIAQHLHQTTARLFIGPLPQGWVKTNRRNWLGIKRKYTSRAITFNAQPGALTAHDTSSLDTGRQAAARDIVEQVSQSATYTRGNFNSRVSTGAQFTSDEEESSAGEIRCPQDQRESSLEQIIETSPVVQFLSPSTRREEEEELRRVEEERAEQEGEDGEIVLLEPVPTRGVTDADVNDLERDPSLEAVVSLSEQPLLKKSGSGSGSGSGRVAGGSEGW